MSKKATHAVVDKIADLQKRGFSSDFVVMDNQLFCTQQKIFLHNDEFDINEVHSFPHTDSRSETILFGIESERHGVRGILLTQPSSHNSAVPNVLFKKMGKFWI